MQPGVMEHFETATRDPAFFRLHKYIDNLFKMHKDLLPPYTRDEVRKLRSPDLLLIPRIPSSYFH